jgi:hypothetical protein
MPALSVVELAIVVSLLILLYWSLGELGIIAV